MLHPMKTADWLSKQWLKNAKRRIPGGFPSKHFIKLRLRMRLTQSELAGLLDVSRRTVSTWEKGRRIPTIVGLAIMHLQNDYERIWKRDFSLKKLGDKHDEIKNAKRHPEPALAVLLRKPSPESSRDAQTAQGFKN